MNSNLVLSNKDLLGLILANLGDVDAVKIRLVSKLWAELAMRYIILTNKAILGPKLAKKIVIGEQTALYTNYTASLFPNVDTLIVSKAVGMNFILFGLDKSLIEFASNNIRLISNIRTLNVPCPVSSSLEYYPSLAEVYIMDVYFDHNIISFLREIPKKYQVKINWKLKITYHEYLAAHMPNVSFIED
jgi:hypothetical protein